ncbi:MAG: RraA family protein [Actinobacteria bacterium]|nr:RraA family protein [Actinomycetota bacterium]
MIKYPVMLKEICKRYRNLYTGAISDTLDKNGLRNQVLPYYVRPLRKDMIIAGPAFTGYGEVSNNPYKNDNMKRIEMLEQVNPLDVLVWETNGDTSSAHWGALMSNSAMKSQATGAVIDGGVRDCNAILEMNFPVFTKFYCSATSNGRWFISNYQIPIKIGNVKINPGDFIMGDIDGVVVIPSEKTYDILLQAEDLLNSESKMSAEMKNGQTLREAYGKYGSI